MQESAAAHADPDLHCPECAYNLRGIDSPRCPECGTVIDRAALAQGRIPWVQRRVIGSVRAYRRTLRLVMLHPGELTAQAQWPVSYDAAWRFRLVTVILAAIPLIAVAGLLHWNTPWEDVFSSFQTDWVNWRLSAVQIDILMPLAVGLSFMPVPLLGIVLYLAAATGIPGWFARPETLETERQNRSVALLQYSSAPLVWMVIPALLYACISASSDVAELVQEVIPWLPWLGHLSALTILIWWWWITARVMHETTESSRRRSALVAVALAAIWSVLAGLTLLVLPWVTGYVYLMVISLL
jgi:hypothetical protein